MSEKENVTPVETELEPGGKFTVAHFNGTTQLWHVEMDWDKIWTTDESLAGELAEGYKREGFPAEVLEAKKLVVGRLLFSGLVLIEDEPEVKL
jgi:hypothetical protein